MLLRLSRVSFWLAASVAALALIAPGGRETLLTSIAVVASAVAFGLWRAGMNQARGAPLRVSVPQAPLLDQAALDEVAIALVRRVQEAPSFEAALHAAAQLLRSELGVREVKVHEVHGSDETHARVSELVESQPGFKTVERRIRLDATPLGRAVQSRRTANDAPPVCDDHLLASSESAIRPLATVAVPVLSGDQVVAAVELTGFEVAVAPAALNSLLELARSTLSSISPRISPHAPPSIPPRNESHAVRSLAIQHGPLQYVQAKVLVVEHNVDELEVTTRMVRRAGCRVTVASGMLEGLQALRRTQFDLVLLDTRPSELDEAEGLKWLRERGSHFDFVLSKNTPVIALTKSDHPQAGERFRDLGFDDHLFRPFHQGEMLAMLSKHLRPSAPAESNDPAGSGRADATGSAPHAGQHGLTVLDPAALGRLSELDPKGANRLVERVLQAFQTSVARLRPQLETARRDGELGSIRLVAHTLKSSSASIGAIKLSQLCAQIEGAIRQSGGAVFESTDANLHANLEAMNTALDGTLAAIAQLLKDRA